MKFQKNKLVRLKGKAQLALMALVYERDKHCCVVCGRWVKDGTKYHHEPCGAGRKSDEIGKVALLCDECHYKRHHTEEAMAIKEKVERYLEWMNDDFEDLRGTNEVYD